MDSFVLAETFKYLYLLFDSTLQPYIDVDQFIFTTEAHILPLHLFSYKINDTLQREFDKKTVVLAEIYDQKNMSLTEKLNGRRATNNQCPAFDDQFKSHAYKEKLRRNIRGDQDMTETITLSSLEVEKQAKK